MSDTYKELLIKQRSNPLGKVLAVLLLIAAGISLLSGIFVHLAFLIGAVACPIIAYFIYFRKKIVEYEYTYMSRELRIDRIYNQIKRKSVAVLNLDKMEILAKENSEYIIPFKNREVKLFDYSTQEEDDETLSTFVMFYDGKEKYVLSLTEEFASVIFGTYASKVKLK